MPRVSKRLITEMADALELGISRDPRPLEVQINEMVRLRLYPCSRDLFHAYRDALHGELERRKRERSERNNAASEHVTPQIRKDARMHELRFGPHEKDGEASEPSTGFELGRH